MNHSGLLTHYTERSRYRSWHSQSLNLDEGVEMLGSPERRKRIRHTRTKLHSVNSQSHGPFGTDHVTKSRKSATYHYVVMKQVKHVDAPLQPELFTRKACQDRTTPDQASICPHVVVCDIYLGLRRVLCRVFQASIRREVRRSAGPTLRARRLG